MSPGEEGYGGMIRDTVRRAGSLVDWLRSRGNGHSIPPVGRMRFGALRRTDPISEVWGSDRGHVIDRYYIERFLSRHAVDVRGHTLEIAGDFYSRKFGGAQVTKIDVLHASDWLPTVTLVGDLTSAEFIAAETFDCIIITQTLQFIYDVHATVRTLHRILKPGGVVLATGGGITKVSAEDMERWGDYWRFTSLSARRLFEEAFPPDQVTVESFGNVLTATAFLYGLAVEDLSSEELDVCDPNFPTIIGVRAVKPHHGSSPSDEQRS